MSGSDAAPPPLACVQRLLERERSASYAPWPPADSRPSRALLVQFGLHFARIRVQLGLSQETIGRAASVSRETIGRMERGTYLLDDAVLVRIGAALGLSPAQVAYELEAI